jgi:hypothetical protein
MTPIPMHQRGMALIVGLILLAVMTLMVIASFNIGRTSLDIVGNMQQRAEAIAAANSLIQEALSTTRMFQTPNNVILDGCNGPNTACVDSNQDGKTDIEVALIPVPFCVQSQTLPNAVLDLNDPDAAACATGAAQVFGIEGIRTGNSLCADSVWEINAQATDVVTGTEIVVTMGAGVRVSTDDIGLTCP